MTTAYKNMRSKFQEMINGTPPSLTTLIKELSKYDDSPLLLNFFRARYYHYFKKYSKASKYITITTEILKSDSLVYVIPRSLNKDIYGYAGEIYANNGQVKESLQAYQNEQVIICRIKSDNDYSDGLLSFRNYNEYSLSDLINNEITVCNPRVMNDPYDTLFIKWGEYIKECNSHRHKKHVIPICNSFEQFRIRSFCKIKNDSGNDMVSNTIMWAHYAGQHEVFAYNIIFLKIFLEQKKDARHVSKG